MIKNNDFIEIEYTGKFTDGKEIFDTTKEDVAKANGLFNPESKIEFKPMTICVGQGQVIKGLDSALVGKKVNDEFTVEVTADQGFGKKDSKLIQLISTNEFKKQNIRPMVGLSVNVDNSMGIIRSVSGGRVIVDFNHPFASKDLTYEVKILRKIEDKVKQIEMTTKSLFNLDSEVKIIENKAEIKFKLPENIPKESFNEEIKKVISEKIKEIVGIEAKITL